ncbi:hypothetical protein [Cryobacterium aureum]|uniref:hypothetical protein n=1 Tax=Cryobacterium aureum TaxID=995037 RepID=UPI00196B71C8|nr:hypothetical protein [Cryobacterium aureum]
MLNPGSVVIPEPLASDEAPGPDTEVADLKFDFSGEQQSIAFIKSDGEWKLRHPEFLNHPVPLDNVQPLIDLGAVIELKGGGDAFAFDYVLFDHASVPVRTQIVSEWFESFDVPDTMLTLTDQGARLATKNDSEQAFETPISEALRQNLIEQYAGVAWKSGHTTTELLEFPEASKCTVNISNLALQRGNEFEATPVCAGGLMRLSVEKAVTLRLDSSSEWKDLPAGRSVEGPIGGILATTNLVTGAVDARDVDFTDELWAELFK